MSGDGKSDDIQVEVIFDLGYRCGQIDGRRKSLAEVWRATELADDLYDLADIVGVLLDPVRLVDEVETFLWREGRA